MRAPYSLLLAGIAIAVVGSALGVHPAVTGDFESWRALKFAFVAVGAAIAGAGLLAAPAPMLGTRLTWADAAGAVYLLWAYVPSLVRTHEVLHDLDGLALDGASLVLAVAATRLADSGPRARAHILRLICATACLVAAIALAEASGARLPWNALHRPYGTLGNRNFIGAYVAIAIPITLGALLRRRSVGASSALLAGALALLGAVLLLTRCRSAWLGLAVGLAASGLSHVWVLRRERARLFPSRRALALAAGAAALAVVVASAVPWPGLRWNDAHPLFSSASRIAESETGSGRSRVDQHVVGWTLIREHPLFGVGAGQWEDSARAHAHAAPGGHAQRWSASPTPHSDLLRIAAERGLPAALALAAAAGLLLLGAASRGFASVVGSLCVGIVHGLFDAPLFRPEAIVLLAVVAGLLRRASPACAYHMPRAAARALVVGLAGLATIMGARELASTVVLTRAHGAADDVARLERAQALYPRQDIEERIAMTLVAQGRCLDAEAHIARGLRGSPTAWGLWELAGSCAETRGNLVDAHAAYLHAAAVEPHDRGLAAAVERTADTMMQPR